MRFLVGISVDNNNHMLVFGITCQRMWLTRLNNMPNIFKTHCLKDR